MCDKTGVSGPVPRLLPLFPVMKYGEARPGGLLFPRVSLLHRPGRCWCSASGCPSLGDEWGDKKVSEFSTEQQLFTSSFKTDAWLMRRGCLSGLGIGFCCSVFAGDFKTEAVKNFGLRISR